MLQPFALVLCQLICYGMHDVQGAPIIATVTLYRPNPSIEQAKGWNFKSDVPPPDSQFMLESTGIKLSPPTKQGSNQQRRKVTLAAGIKAG